MLLHPALPNDPTDYLWWSVATRLLLVLVASARLLNLVIPPICLILKYIARGLSPQQLFYKIFSLLWSTTLFDFSSPSVQK